MDNPCGKHGKTVLPSGEARKIEEKKTVLVSFSMEKQRKRKQMVA